MQLTRRDLSYLEQLVNQYNASKKTKTQTQQILEYPGRCVSLATAQVRMYRGASMHDACTKPRVKNKHGERQS